MRVISGIAKGRKLESLSEDGLRPTTDKIKEAIFDVIQFEIEGRIFLDLFAGSGQMAIEALSRGANLASIVDNSLKSINIIKNNLQKSNLADKAETFNMDYDNFLKINKRTFDVIFLDPPYRKGLLQKALEKVVKITNKNGVIICENPVEENLPEKIDKVYLNKSFKYGKIKTSYYRSENDV